MPDDPKKQTGKAAAVVGVAVMCSRILGLAREMIFNGLFGAGRTLDIFITAFRIPNLLRDLFAEGALSTAFVTTFSKKIAAEGDAPAWRLACKVGTLTLVVMSALTLLGIVFSSQLIGLLAGGFTGEDAILTAQLTALMFPFILLVSLAALAMGMLNAKHVFGWPAMASSFFNIGSIAGGVALGWWLDPHFGRRALFGLGIGTLIGGLLQLVVQFPALGKIGFRPRLDFAWRDEGVRAVLRLMAPAIVAASAVQVNVMINTSFASHCEQGSVAWLNNAFRLMQLPLGIFGVAIGTVTLPLLAKSIALGNRDEFRVVLARGMRLALALTIPSSVGLIMLARPIISLIYEHGKVTAYQTDQSAAALRFYALGLVAYSAMKVLAPAFYAIDKRKTPMIVSFAAIGVNLLLNWIFTFRMNLGHRGLALSTGGVATINFLVLYMLMRRETGALETRQMCSVLVKLLIASAALGAVCGASQTWVLSNWSQHAFLWKGAMLFATIAAAGAVFFVVARLLRIEELDEFTDVVRRKLGRRFSRP
jgi:putative peptidoglycan lipid II flippase